MRYTLLFLFALLVVSTYAREISEKEAKQMALEFLNNNHPHSSVQDLQMIYDGENATTRANNDTNPAFYVFNNPQQKGFVIVSGDDIAKPILAYSYENEFPQDNLPIHIQSWLEGIKLQINDGRSRGVVVASTTTPPTSRAGQMVVKLETAKWGQDKPFNAKTPRIGFTQTPAGCVITAAATIMHYHKWPAHGTGIVPEYQTETHKLTRPSIQLGHTYEWDGMLSNYSGYYTPQQADMVAQLMIDLGTMFKADYTTSATSALSEEVAYKLPVYMDYDKSALTRNRFQYTDEEWHQMMMNELNQGRPIFYFGSNWFAGHAFVLDGYDTERFYSVNWGWNGMCDGWYQLDALKPEGSGTGGNNDHYNLYQGAITDLKPNEGGDYVELIGFNVRGLSTRATEFVMGQPFTLTTHEIWNYGGTTFEGPIMFALTDREGTIKEELATDTIIGLHPGWGCERFNKEITIHVPIEYGYRIRLFYKSFGASEWKLLKSGDNCQWELLVADEYSIAESTRVIFDKKERILTTELMHGVIAELFDEKGTDLNHLRVTLTNKCSFLVDDLPAGVYLLRLSNDKQSHEVKIKLGAPLNK